MIELVCSIAAVLVSIVSATAAGVWVVSQKHAISREDLDQILSPIVAKLDRLNEKLADFAANYVKRDEFNHTIDGLRHKVVNHISNVDIHLNNHEKTNHTLD